MKPGKDLSEAEVRLVDQFSDFLLENGVQLLCLDYDLTVCSIHTRGESVVKDQSRPVFKYMFDSATKRGIKVAITTFHPMIPEVTAEVSRFFEVEATDIIVRSQTNTDTVTDMNFYFKGKTPMIESAWKAYFKDTEDADKVDFSKCFLFDDDIKNIKMARYYGCPAEWFLPDESETIRFLNRICPKEEITLQYFLKISNDYKPPNPEEELKKRMIKLDISERDLRKPSGNRCSLM